MAPGCVKCTVISDKLLRRVSSNFFQNRRSWFYRLFCQFSIQVFLYFEAAFRLSCCINVEIDARCYLLILTLLFFPACICADSANPKEVSSDFGLAFLFAFHLPFGLTYWIIFTTDIFVCLLSSVYIVAPRDSKRQ